MFQFIVYRVFIARPFAISDKEYPIGYTSFLVMDTDSRFIVESIFEDLKNFT